MYQKPRVQASPGALCISVRVVQGGRLKFCWRKPRGFEPHLMHSGHVAQLDSAPAFYERTQFLSGRELEVAGSTPVVVTALNDAK